MGVRHSMKNETIGIKIRHIRESKGKSQEQVADKADMSQQHLSRIENDEVSPTTDTLMKIAKALEVSLWSITDEEIVVEEEKCIIQMIRKLERMTHDDKMKVSGYIDCLYNEENRKKR